MSVTSIPIIAKLEVSVSIHPEVTAATVNRVMKLVMAEATALVRGSLLIVSHVLLLLYLFARFFVN